MKNVIEATEEGEPPILRRISEAAGHSLKIQKIVVPLDFSEASMQALDIAVPLAHEFHSSVHLLHAFDTEGEFTPSEGAGGVLLDRAARRMITHRQLCAVQLAHSVRVRADDCHVLPGRAAAATCDFAHDSAADLIVLSSRGKTGLTRVLLGSTAESIVRHAPCPVMVVRQRAGRGTTASAERVPFRTILVPVDFSESAGNAVEYAAGLARKFDARLVLYHALFPHDLVMDRAVADPEWTHKLEIEPAKEQLEELAQVVALQGVECDVAIGRGYPAAAICAEADRAHADLIVTSTHGYTGLKHVLIGSVAEHVVRHAGCPVLVIPRRWRTGSQ